jgi:hypothetical protein
VTFCEEREKFEKGVVGMRHRWTSAVLALLLAGLMCFSLTGCELEEESTDSSGDNTTVSNYNYEDAKPEKKTVKEDDKDVERWIMTRTWTEAHVAKQLQKDQYCLEQAEVVATTESNPEIKQVSLLYALNATTYFNYLKYFLTEAENGLTEDGLNKKDFTTDRRYALITFDYQWCTHEESHGEDPVKVTIQYGTETIKTEEISDTIWTTVCDMDCATNNVTYVTDSGHALTETVGTSSFTTRQIMNAALRLALGQTDLNETVSITTKFEDNLFDLADDAKELANTILLDTKAARNAM